MQGWTEIHQNANRLSLAEAQALNVLSLPLRFIIVKYSGQSFKC